MRHKRAGRKLGVVTKHRKSMLRTLVTDFLRNERLKTTDTRAKELRRVAEKMITLGKRGTLHARRLAAAFIRDKEVLKKLFDEIAPKFSERPGGYTRIIKLGIRRGDNAPLSQIELVTEEYKPKEKKKAKKTRKEKEAFAGAVAAKSRKKEAAEDLGLIEGEEKVKAEAKTGETGSAVKAEMKEKQAVVAQDQTEEAKPSEQAEPSATEEKLGAKEAASQVPEESEAQEAETSEARAEATQEESSEGKAGTKGTEVEQVEPEAGEPKEQEVKTTETKEPEVAQEPVSGSKAEKTTETAEEFKKESE